MDFKVMLIGTSQLSFPGDKAGRFHKAAEELKVFLADLGASLVVYPENVITAEDAKRSLTMVHAEKPVWQGWLSSGPVGDSGGRR